MIDLISMSWTQYPDNKYFFFVYSHETRTTTDYLLGHQKILNKSQKSRNHVDHIDFFNLNNLNVLFCFTFM